MLTKLTFFCMFTSGHFAFINMTLLGAPCNLYVYYALMKNHDRLMGLDLPHGGQ